MTVSTTIVLNEFATIYGGKSYMQTGLSRNKLKQEIFDNFISRHGLDIMKYGRQHAFNLLRKGLVEHYKCRKCSKPISRSNSYCDMNCYKTDHNINTRLSQLKKSLYNNAEWKLSVEKKKMETNQNNLGVNHPMQSLESRQKHLSNSFKRKMYKGRYFQGYEIEIVKYFESMGFELDKHVIQGEEALKIFDKPLIDSGGRYRFPDLYFIPGNIMIEVKSMYTLESSKDRYENIDTTTIDMDYDILVFDKGDVLSYNMETSKFEQPIYKRIKVTSGF